MISAQAALYDWETKMADRGDFTILYVQTTKPAGRTFLMRLQFDDYPEVAPELRFLNPSTFDDPEATRPDAQYCPKGSYMAAGRGPFPVPCIKGHREYYARGWHIGWTNPPAHDHSPYQLVLNLRNAIIDVWS